MAEKINKCQICDKRNIEFIVAIVSTDASKESGNNFHHVCRVCQNMILDYMTQAISKLKEVNGNKKEKGKKA